MKTAHLVKDLQARLSSLLADPAFAATLGATLGTPHIFTGATLGTPHIFTVYRI
jgi:hypothetical protein